MSGSDRIERELAGALGVPDREPLPERVMAVRAAAREVVLPKPSRRRRLPELALAAALVGALVVFGWLLVRPGATGDVEYDGGIASADGALQGDVEVRKTGIGRVVTLMTDDLEILPENEFYEVWFVGPGDAPGAVNRISAGTFHPDSNGRTDVTLTAAVDPVKYPALAVTAEPGDGDPSPDGPDVLRANLD